MEFENGISLGKCYGYQFKNKKLSQQDNTVTDTNVLQEANTEMLPLMDSMLKDVLLPGSDLKGQENIKEFLGAVCAGKRGLILMEHYSNFDLPGFSYILRMSGCPEAVELANRLIAIAGMKLNEENPMVNAWASAYSRIIIYPSRSLSSIKDLELRAKEETRSRTINMASMRALDSVRKQGKVVLVFPSGTRFRKDNPETKRGVREIDSYLRLSDVILPVAINGNCLRISESDPKNMLADEVWHDKVFFTAGKVIDCKSFRKDIQDQLPEDLEDKKQPVVDRIMQILEEMHKEAEKGRL